MRGERVLVVLQPGLHHSSVNVPHVVWEQIPTHTPKSRLDVSTVYRDKLRSTLSGSSDAPRPTDSDWTDREHSLREREDEKTLRVSKGGLRIVSDGKRTVSLVRREESVVVFV